MEAHPSPASLISVPFVNALLWNTDWHSSRPVRRHGYLHHFDHPVDHHVDQLAAVVSLLQVIFRESQLPISPRPSISSRRASTAPSTSPSQTTSGLRPIHSRPSILPTNYRFARVFTTLKSSAVLSMLLHIPRLLEYSSSKDTESFMQLHTSSWMSFSSLRTAP